MPSFQITEQQMKDMFPKCKDVKEYVNAFNQLLPKYDITTKEQWQFWLAQYGTETQGFTRLIENTNYTTPELLMKVFPKYFPSLFLAKMYAGKPVNIANRVYAGRYGNGDENSGDGYKYRGRGCCHLTFKDNYSSFAKATGVDVISHPEFLEEVWYAVLAGAWYWQSHSLNNLVAKNDFTGCTRGVNGGLNGLEDREANLKKIKQVLG